MKKYELYSKLNWYKKFALSIVSIFGLGFFPKGSGTLGSFVALPFVFAVISAGGVKYLLISSIVIGVIAFYFTHVVVSDCAVEDEDPSFIIIDEVLGQFVTFILPAVVFPIYSTGLMFFILGFILFRLFDIIKPWHVGLIDKNVKGSAGINCDDIVAGVYASIILTALVFGHKIFLYGA